MKPTTKALLATSAIVMALALHASAQCDPGPAVGGGINRCYEDGYVFLDSSGNLNGTTWYWGYERSDQVENGFLAFHSRTVLDPSTTQVLTDTYDVRSITLPEAPYNGSFQGPGTVIPDAPFSRSIEVIPEPSPMALLGLCALALAGRFAIGQRSPRTTPR